MTALENPVLAVVFAAIFFYILYGVIRAGVRDGILQADELRQKTPDIIRSSGKRG